jgi:AcrR family transcriptional regulator
MRIIDDRVDPAGSARERVLLTAHALFYREGIRATGIDRVILEAAVTKATFYRHFPSKNDLVCAFLERRHTLWMAWFVEALERLGGNVDALTAALAEWFNDPGFRGCAFINSAGELGGVVPQVLEISRRHKQDVVGTIAALLPPSRRRLQQARALCVAMDGAIVRATFDESPKSALLAFRSIAQALVPPVRPSAGTVRCK